MERKDVLILTSSDFDEKMSFPPVKQAGNQTDIVSFLSVASTSSPNSPDHHVKWCEHC